MNRYGMLLATGLVATAWASSAQAQKLEYDCDTQAEHYSVLKAVQPGPNYTASATISPRALYTSKKYATMGKLEFAAADGSWRARLGFDGLMAGKDAVLMATLEIRRNGKTEEPQSLGMILEYSVGKTYPIRLNLGPDGGTAMLGDHQVPVDLKANGPVDVSVTCSGGEFLFTDLVLGR